MGSREFWLSFGPLVFVNCYVLLALVVFVFVSKKRPTTAEIQDRRDSVILNKWIREFWLWLTMPVFNFFIAIKMTPNRISVLATFIALTSAAAFAFGRIGLGGWLMVLSACCDFFDGRVARATNRESRAGSFLDSCMDRVSEGIVLSGIAFMYRHSFVFWIVMAAYLGSIITSYAKSKAENMGIQYGGGMMQRPERVVYLGSGAVFTPMIVFLISPWLVKFLPNYSLFQIESALYALPISMVAIFGMSAAYNRLVNVVKLLNKQEFGEPESQRKVINYK